METTDTNTRSYRSNSHSMTSNALYGYGPFTSRLNPEARAFEPRAEPPMYGHMRLFDFQLPNGAMPQSPFPGGNWMRPNHVTGEFRDDFFQERVLDHSDVKNYGSMTGPHTECFFQERPLDGYGERGYATEHQYRPHHHDTQMPNEYSGADHHGSHRGRQHDHHRGHHHGHHQFGSNGPMQDRYHHENMSSRGMHEPYGADGRFYQQNLAREYGDDRQQHFNGQHGNGDGQYKKSKKKKYKKGQNNNPNGNDGMNEREQRVPNGSRAFRRGNYQNFGHKQNDERNGVQAQDQSSRGRRFYRGLANYTNSDDGSGDQAIGNNVPLTRGRIFSDDFENRNAHNSGHYKSHQQEGQSTEAIHPDNLTGGPGPTIEETVREVRHELGKQRRRASMYALSTKSFSE